MDGNGRSSTINHQPSTGYTAVSCLLDLPCQNQYYFLMYIDDFLWLPDIVEKLWVKHRVSQDETEEIFFNRPLFRFVESGHRSGEDVYFAAGQSDAGRYLIVFFIRKPGSIALILSARDMDKKERKQYERKR